MVKLRGFHERLAAVVGGGIADGNLLERKLIEELRGEFRSSG